MSKLFKRTKILATIGPAVDSEEKITNLIMAGVNGCRFNASHGTDEERVRQLQWVRAAAARKGRAVATLLDLPGPKIRLGALKDNRLDVKRGDQLILDYGIQLHDGSHVIPVQYNLAMTCRPGEPILMFDGMVRTHVVEVVSDTAIKVEVENDGFLMSKKGLNLPETDFGEDVLTEKDMAEVEFAAQQDYDYIALSFVRSAEDVNRLRQMMLASGSNAQLIAKIETKAAIQTTERLAEIVEAADGIMVARGDLAVEAGAEVVPVAQRKLIALCREHAKLCIVATQMMGSMVEHPDPTRAEVSDVASAVIQGADAVMLSDETANGRYPLEAVQAMRKVILYTQNHTHVAPLPGRSEKIMENLARLKNYNALAFAAVRLAEHIHADLLVCQSTSGATAAAVSAQRPSLPIITVTVDERVAGQLALSYGTAAFMRPYAPAAGVKLVEELKGLGYLRRYDGGIGTLLTVVVSGDREMVGATDTIKVRYI